MSGPRRRTWLLLLFVGAVLGARAFADPVPDAEAVIKEIIARMTLREQVAQRFVGYVTGTELSSAERALILASPPGGFMLFPYNAITAEQTVALIEHLNDLAGGVRPFICVDQEGGRVVTIQFDPHLMVPSAAEVGAVDSPTHTLNTAKVVGARLLELGVTMNLAPVADVYPYADRSIIGDRSFGGSPETVARHVEAYLDGMSAAGVIPVVKHFPGHGITTVDSHGELPVVAESRAALDRHGLVPFARAIEHGAPVVMVGHLLFEAIDPDYPATISDVLINDVLRADLGFDGLVMTDAIEMQALRSTVPIDELLERLFRLEVDLILVGHYYDVSALINRVVSMIEDGTLDAAVMDRPLRRILSLKHEFGLIEEGD